MGYTPHNVSIYTMTAVEFLAKIEYRHAPSQELWGVSNMVWRSCGKPTPFRQISDMFATHCIASHKSLVPFCKYAPSVKNHETRHRYLGTFDPTKTKKSTHSECITVNPLFTSTLNNMTRHYYNPCGILNSQYTAQAQPYPID